MSRFDNKCISPNCRHHGPPRLGTLSSYHLIDDPLSHHWGKVHYKVSQSHCMNVLYACFIIICVIYLTTIFAILTHLNDILHQCSLFVCHSGSFSSSIKDRITVLPVFVSLPTLTYTDPKTAVYNAVSIIQMLSKGYCTFGARMCKLIYDLDFKYSSHNIM